VSGCIYDEETGEIVVGGKIVVQGPNGPIIPLDNGLDGCYAFDREEGGPYTITLIPPRRCSASVDCLSGPPLAPMGNPDPPCDDISDPCILGSNVLGGSLQSAACIDNPFVVVLNLGSEDPSVVNNHFPVVCEPLEVPVPAASSRGLGILLVLLFGVACLYLWVTLPQRRNG
jgi:hypothetical protein